MEIKNGEEKKLAKKLRKPALTPYKRLVRNILEYLLA